MDELKKTRILFTFLRNKAYLSPFLYFSTPHNNQGFTPVGRTAILIMDFQAA